MPGDNIYPDLSNDKFDIQYARLMGLSSDLRSSFGVFTTTPAGGRETPSDDDTGIIHFGVAAEDDTATENRIFDLNGAYRFALTQLGNNQFLVDPPNGLYQLGAIPVPGSDSGLSYTYLEIDDTTGKITLQAAEGIILPGYGVGVHVATPAYSLGVDASGNLVEFIGGSGGYTNLTQFVDQNNWKVFYSDGNGDVQELSIGASGDVLTSNGTSSAPSWQTPTGGSSITADNGLTMSTATNVQLGGTGIQNTSIAWSNFTFTNTWNTLSGSGLILSSTSTAAAGNLQRLIEVSLSGANSNFGQTTSAIYAINTHSGSVNTNHGIMGQASGGTLNRGVYGLAGSGTNSYGVVGESTSTSGTGVLGQAGGGSGAVGVRGTINTSGVALKGEMSLTSNAIGRGIELLAYNQSGAGGTGLGSSISWILETTTNDRDAGAISVKWADGTDATRTSQLVITGVNSAVTADLFTLSGSGALQLNKYGLGNFTGTPAYTLQVDASGNIIEGSAAGGSVTADNGLHIDGGSGDVYLGGTLLTGTTINGGSNMLTLTSAVAGANQTLVVDNTGTGKAINATSIDDIGIQVTTSNTYAINASSSNAGAIQAATQSGIPYTGTINSGTNNGISRAIDLLKGGASTPADGIGMSINFSIENTTGGVNLANQIISKWAIADESTRTSQLIFTGVGNGSGIDLMRLNGDGSWQITPITATAASAITPAEGMFVFVSNTNGTFTSIGPWCYYNGAWNAL